MSEKVRHIRVNTPTPYAELDEEAWFVIATYSDMAKAVDKFFRLLGDMKAVASVKVHAFHHLYTFKGLDFTKKDVRQTIEMYKKQDEKEELQMWDGEIDIRFIRTN